MLAFFSKDLQLEAVAYDNYCGMRPRRIDLTAVRGQNSLRRHLEYIHTPEAEQLCRNMQRFISTPPGYYYSKVASSLRVALTELTSGNVGQIIGKADENRFIKRLEQGS